MPADDMRGGRRGGGGGGGGESEEGAYVQDAEGRGSGECNCFDLKAYLACSITRCNFLSLSGGRWGPAVTELDSPPVALTLFFPGLVDSRRQLIHGGLGGAPGVACYWASSQGSGDAKRSNRARALRFRRAPQQGCAVALELFDFLVLVLDLHQCRIQFTLDIAPSFLLRVLLFRRPIP
jgi:hypothetical protein